jgi:hypothetical protein
MRHSPDSTAFLRRLALSYGVVLASLLPGFISLGINAVLLPWLLVLHIFGDVLKVLPNFEAYPVIFGLGTFLILALAAKRLVASVITTVWFALNALFGWLMIVTLFNGMGP